MGLFKEKIQKPILPYETLNVFIEDCLISLKDDKYDINAELTTVNNGHKYNIELSIKKGLQFQFKDVKHDVLQLHNMLSDYDASVKFDIIYRYQWEYIDGKIKYKNLLKGVYDNIWVSNLIIKIGITEHSTI